jgi:hypothetical protein
MNVPKANAVFKPRADAGMLSQLVQNAWRNYEANNFSAEERASVAAAVSEHIRSLYPLQDMTLLAKYGCASLEDYVSVRVHDGENWAQSFGIKLPEPILVARNSCAMSYYSGGPWFSKDPARGITAKLRATMTESEWLKLCANQDASEAARIPEVLKPYFNKLMAARGSCAVSRAANHEDYSKVRTLASFEHAGITFRVVRRRFDGKHWRGYLALLCGNIPMTHDDFKSGCAVKAAAEWKERTERTFPQGSEEKLAAIIADMTAKYGAAS